MLTGKSYNVNFVPSFNETMSPAPTVPLSYIWLSAKTHLQMTRSSIAPASRFHSTARFPHRALYLRLGTRVYRLLEYF